jgi:hypothetical protein
MKSFGEWLGSDPAKHIPAATERPAESAEKKSLQHEVDILRELVTDSFSDLRWTLGAGWEFKCRGCDQWRELEDIDHYSSDMAYCGGSERCIP